MAKLTSTLETVDSGKRIVAPAQSSGTSFLGGLAALGSDLGRSLTIGKEKERLEGDRKVLNKAAMGIQDLRSANEASLRLGANPTDTSQVPTGASSEGGNILPPDLARAGEDLQRTKKAVDQGRSNQEALDLKIERFVTDTMRSNPERAELVFEWAAKHGFDHYMFRKGEAQSDIMDAEVKGVGAGRQAAIAKATAMGHQGEPEFLYQKGVELEQLETQAAQMKALREAQAAGAREGREAAEWEVKQLDRMGGNLYRGRVASDIGTIMHQANQVIMTAGSSPEAIKKLQEIGGLSSQFITTYTQNLRAQMSADGLSQDTQNSIISDVERQAKAMSDLFSGPDSRIMQNTRTLKYMTEEFGIEAGKSLNFYSWTKEIFGNAAVVDSIFGQDNPLPLSDNLKKQIASEIENFDPTKKNQGFEILTKLGKLVAGDESLADMPESEITGDFVKGLVTAFHGSADAILDPEPDQPGEYKTLLGSYGNLIIAANGISTGYKDLNGWAFALDTLTAGKGSAALSGLMKREGPFQGQARTTYQAGRSSVARLLEVGRDVVTPPSGQGIKVVNGRFEAFNNNKQVQATGYGQSEMPIFNGTKNAPPSANMVKQAQMMNKAVDFLVNTAAADPSLKGVPPEELRRAYLNGTPIPRKDGEGTIKPTADWNASANALAESLKGGINTMPVPERPTTPISFRDDRDAAIRTIIGEAGGEGEAGMKAVAGVLRNRSKSSGKSIEKVVLAPKQFEAWASRSRELMSISEDDPRYLAAAKAWDSEEDPTGGADHFYAPKLQADLGRSKPDWDDGTGRDIGNHRFFKRGYKG